MSNLPFPSNENSLQSGHRLKSATELPWKRSHPNDPPLMMFQVHFFDGRVTSYAYSDLREVRLRDAGHLQLCLFGMEKYHVTIEGRNMIELAELIGAGKMKSLMEMGPRTFERAEQSPSIDKVTIETLSGPAY
ncbi:hypothetical protein Pla110_24650 [Polystyrenella longa]|uniref:Uncharacterized protein n=1 Tax=Polystyrenella longa TaxID=2528007 RepID=A0A518CNC6_9PLAN|nr:hypothetical protein [Polystyrenella longa]QDU80732.1 hypothetical protein Pla110_24650 [Polystyrenella longa]